MDGGVYLTPTPVQAFDLVGGRSFPLSDSYRRSEVEALGRCRKIRRPANGLRRARI